ncbi:MAG: hypothetical protein RML46_03840 [Anaerolineae bacterium]|nr:hypothetical protein [Anaerolineae bacterium]MDW8068024.1 hypothetical protein [Anaerolineae bacterium]
MRNRLSVIGVLILQAIAIILYPPTFFREAPQAAVLPPALLILMLLALIGMNSGILTPVAGRVSLVFVQGLNVVIRLLTIPPHLRASEGGNWPFLILSALSIVLSWLTIIWMERRHPRALLLRRAEKE